MTVSELQQRDDLAAYMFPTLWSKIKNAPGKSKARQQCRQRAEGQVKLDEMAAAGRSCASCDAYRRGSGKAKVCMMDTDFYGEAHMPPTGLCIRWHAKP